MSGSDVRVSGENCRGGEEPTSSATPGETGKVAWAATEVGGVRSSEEAVLDLWWAGQNTEERRDATCSAAEKSGKGRGDGPQGLPAPDRVRKLQITLYRKAKADARYRFWSLYGEITREDVLETAWRRVAENGGAPGVDGQSIESIRKGGVERWLRELREELRRKEYKPTAVLRVRIPKPAGGWRELGIPTVKDRVVQMAVNLVLTPIFEADFHDRSYGYRVKRSAHGAVEAIREGLRMGKVEIVDADLSRYFDTIPHGRLMRLVARRISDGTVLKLIASWLKAPIEEREKGTRRLRANTRGTPQGGVASPLLANIYLNPLDHAVNERCRKKPRMVRYADDLIILCRPGEGAEMKQRLDCWLTASGLKLNEEKTRVINTREEGFEFLGFTFRWQRSKKGSDYVHTEPSWKSRKALHKAVRELTPRKTTWRAAREVVEEVNAVVRGWGQYFGICHYGEVFRKTNRFTAHRLRQWLWRKHGNPSGKYKRWTEDVLHEQYGLYRLPSGIWS